MASTWGALQTWGDLNIWWLEPQPAQGGGSQVDLFTPPRQKPRKEKHARLRVYHATWATVAGHKEAEGAATGAVRESVAVGRGRMTARGSAALTVTSDVTFKATVVRVGGDHSVIDQRSHVEGKKHVRSSRSLADEQLILSAFTHFFGGSA